MALPRSRALPALPAALPALSCLLAAALALGGGCGQHDPAFAPRANDASFARGAIFITSSVPGAAIDLDGRATGQVTPDTLAGVPAGPHEVAVFLTGYRTASDSVLVAAGSIEEAHFALLLIPTTGAIAVVAGYPADIALDGVTTGQTAPDTLRAVEPGPHAVTLRLPGFTPQPGELRVEVEADRVVAARFDLTATRRVLCEDFSNYACAPCLGASLALAAAVRAAAPGSVQPLNVHAGWPSAGDPFYQFNPVANQNRMSFYNVFQLPTITVDGARLQDPHQQPAIAAAIEQRLLVEQPLAIGVRGKLKGGTYAVTVDVWVTGAGAPAGATLFTCVVETEVVLDPPAPSGQSVFHNVLRQLLPPPVSGNDPGGGVELALTPEAHETFTFSYDVPGGVDPARLAAIAFVQEASTYEIVQTGTSLEP